MIELPYIISDEAQNDLTEIAIWYDNQKEYLGDDFLNEFYFVVMKKICDNAGVLQGLQKTKALEDV